MGPSPDCGTEAARARAALELRRQQTVALPTDVALGLDGGIELDGALEALLADADALAEQTVESTAAARWRAAGDAAFFGFGSSLSQVLNSETSLATRNVCGNGVLLKSLN